MASYGTKEKKEIINEFKINEADTGSIELQVSLLTHRINHLVSYLKSNKKDSHTRAGLLKLVGKRKKFIKYLRKSNPVEFTALAKKLKLKEK